MKKTSEFADNNKERWIKSGKSVDDQLKEINKFNENKIEFAFKGEKIYPKSIKVIKIQSSSFKKDLNFKRIKNVYYEYNSTLHFTLSSIKYTNENEIKELRTTASTKTTTLSTIASTSITPSLPSPPKRN